MVQQATLGVGQEGLVVASAVTTSAQGVEAPIVEDGRAAVASAKALLVHATLAELLAEVDHHRARADGGGDDHRGDTRLGAAGEEVGGDALLVVVLEEREHVRTDIIDSLPAFRDA